MNNITKKLLIAAGLFAQLSNLQALNSTQQSQFDTALTDLGNPLADSMSIKDAKSSVDALSLADQTVADTLKAYLTNLAPSIKKSAFKNADMDYAKSAKNQKLQALRPAPTQAAASVEPGAGAASAAGNSGDSAQAQAQIQALQSQLQEAQKQTAEAQQKLATAKQAADQKLATAKKTMQEKIDQLTEMVTSKHQDLKALVDASQGQAGAAKYIPAAKQAAQSLKDAINAIENEADRAAVKAEVQKILQPTATGAQSAQQAHNLGRLGKHKKTKPKA